VEQRSSVLTTHDQNRLAELSFGLSALERKAVQLAKSTTALSWGLLGSTVGYLFGSVWTHVDTHSFLSTREVAGLGYFIFLACYAILEKSYFATGRCLTNAKLLSISDRVTEKEYNRMRNKCLKKGELI
jgi:hypothetical protein